MPTYLSREARKLALIAYALNTDEWRSMDRPDADLPRTVWRWPLNTPKTQRDAVRAALERDDMGALGARLDWLTTGNKFFRHAIALEPVQEAIASLLSEGQASEARAVLAQAEAAPERPPGRAQGAVEILAETHGLPLEEAAAMARADPTQGERKAAALRDAKARIAELERENALLWELLRLRRGEP